MVTDNDNPKHRIPLRFVDTDNSESSSDNDQADMSTLDPDNESSQLSSDPVEDPSDEEVFEAEEPEATEAPRGLGGPAVAELVATRAELKRVETENRQLTAEIAEFRDVLARRQADFDNYRKRVERERAETYNRVVADVALKLVGVLDNLKRALDSEASVEASESDEFRHFFNGVDLIYKQFNSVLEGFGVQPIEVVGETFDPHIHEAVATEVSDQFEPDTVMQEIRTGYRLGDKLIRPSLVKVSARG